MAKVLETYPIVDNDIIYKINPEINKLRVYSSPNMEDEIQITKDSEKENSYYIDDNGSWSPATNDFICNGNLILTSLYKETGDIYLVADVLGHKDVNTTKKHYAAIDDDRRKRAASAVKLREP